MFLYKRINNEEKLIRLINSKKNKELTYDNKNEALIVASKFGYLDIVELMILTGANIEFMNKSKWNALQIACDYGQLEMAKFLISKGARIDNINILDASDKGYVEIVELIISEWKRNNKNITELLNFYAYGTALYRACQSRHLDIIKLLAHNYIDTLIGWNTALVYISNIGDINLAKIMISNGANVNCNIGAGNPTPLTCASSRGHIEYIKFLISNGADVNLCDEYGCNALMSASSGGYTNIVKFLIANGADVNKYNIYGKNALMMCKYGLDVSGRIDSYDIQRYLDTIKLLETKTNIEQNFRNNECPICIEIINKKMDEIIICNYCKNGFHNHCINQCINNLCPLCRKIIN